jgi:hypothetical protein
MGETLKRLIKEAEVQKKQVELASNTMQEELREIQGERIVAEVEAKRHISSLEATFEKVVAEKESENSTLRQLYSEAVQELEDLKQRLEIEKATVKGLSGRQRQPTQNEIDTFLPLLHALWQVTSEPSQASQALQGSPKLLEAIYIKLEAWKPDQLKEPSANLGRAATAPHLPQVDEIWQVLPALCGILVNIASSTDGRRAITRTANGGLLQQILRALDWTQKENGLKNQIVAELVGMDQLGAFNTGNSSKLSSVVQEAPENIDNTVELLLCIVSNICAEKTSAIAMIRAGVVDSLKKVILHEKKDSLRRYAATILKVIMVYIPSLDEAGGRRVLNNNGVQVNQVDLYTQIGDIISSLSRDKAMKMIGLDLLGELQRVMPAED